MRQRATQTLLPVEHAYLMQTVMETPPFVTWAVGAVANANQQQII